MFGDALAAEELSALRAAGRRLARGVVEAALKSQIPGHSVWERGRIRAGWPWSGDDLWRRIRVVRDITRVAGSGGRGLLARQPFPHPGGDIFGSELALRGGDEMPNAAEHLARAPKTVQGSEVARFARRFGFGTGRLDRRIGCPRATGRAARTG